MFTKLYKRNELYFSLFWIGLYVIIMNTALRFCNGFDHLTSKTVSQLLPAVICILLLAVIATVWILRNGLVAKYGLCCGKGTLKSRLWILPLLFVSCINLRNGLGLSAPAAVSCLMMANLAAAGYVEELIFRGFLFRAMEKDNLTTAVIVSAVTFGAGHIVNLANTSDVLGVLLQVCYAVAIGFLYTVIVYKCSSLWPCIASHMFVNGSSVFSLEQGAFTTLIRAVFGQGSPELVQIVCAALIIVVSGSCALWMWYKT